MTRPAITLRKFALLVAGGSFVAGLAPAVHADEAASAADSDRGARLNIAPLRLELDGSKPGATLMLTNTSARALPVQTRLFAWSQEGGEDRFTPSGEVTISPSIITIAPGQTQIVRLLRGRTASPGEKRFRLTVDQLPDPALARAGEAEARIRFTIPMFIDRDKAAPAQLAWRVAADRIELANAGGATARVIKVEVRTAAGRIVPVERNALRYVQGRSTIAWPIANGCALGPVTISALVDGQTADVQASPTCG